jgi:predicted nucleic acid-binding protein
MRVLLDTNVVLDFVLQRNPFFAEADEIFIKLKNAEFVGYVSPITPINVFFTTRKEKGKDIAFIAVGELLTLTDITKISKRHFENALNSTFKDYEDSVQHESAISENLDAIITRNTKDFSNSNVKIYSPKEFLEILEQP